MIVLANATKPYLLSLQITALNGWYIRLFKNDIEPTGETLAEDFVECDFPGYASQSLSGWSPAYLNEEMQGQTDVGLISWTMSSVSPTNDIYGYYVTDSGGQLRYSERAVNGPYTITQNKEYTVYVSLRLDSLVEPHE